MENNNNPAKDENLTRNTPEEALPGATGKKNLSGQSMIAENNAENTQGSGLTAGNVVGGVAPANSPNPPTENSEGDPTTGSDFAPNPEGQQKD